MVRTHTLLSFMCLIAAVAVMILPLHDAAAFHLTAPTQPTCTDSPDFDPDNSNSPGIVTTIVQEVKNVTDSMAQGLFTAIQSSQGFKNTIGALILLYIGIYGAFFALGMATETVYEFTIRIIKIWILALLINGDAWTFFYDNVVQLCTTAVDDLIDVVTSVAVGGTGAPTGEPLGVLDNAINKAFSAKMLVHLAAMFTTGMYGFMHAVLAGLALMSLAGAFLLAIWIYLMSLVMRTLLFGLAPIFLACMLFERTKPVFLGWINQIVSVCLQPIFLFTFLSFFLALIGAAIDDMLLTPVCWTEVADTMRGTPFFLLLPRFTIPDSTGSGWLEYKGNWFWQGIDPENASAALTPLFPVDIMAILTFFMLTQLAGHFSQVVVLLAKDIASGAANLLTMQSGIQQFFAPGESASGGVNKIGDRVGPDGRGPTGRTEAVSAEEMSDASNKAQQGKDFVKDIFSQIKDVITKRDGPGS